MCPNSSWSPRSSSSKGLSEPLVLAESALCVCRFWARRTAALHSAGLWAFIKDSTVCTLAPSECDFEVDWKRRKGNEVLLFFLACLTLCLWGAGGLMVSALDYGSSGLDSSTGRGNCLCSCVRHLKNGASANQSHHRDLCRTRSSKCNFQGPVKRP